MKNYSSVLYLTMSLILGLISSSSAQINENFNGGASGFSYQDDLFKGTNAPAYASGQWAASGGNNGSGGLTVSLGGIDNNATLNMSGGWTENFSVNAAGDHLLTFKFKILQSGTYEQDEISELLLAIDGQLIGNGSKDYIDQIKGNGQTDTNPVGSDQFFEFRKVISSLSAGQHTISIGGFNSKKTLPDESTSIAIDDIVLEPLQFTCENPDETNVQKLLDRLDFDDYRQVIVDLANFGDRSQLTGAGSTSYDNAEAWCIQQFQNMGYNVEFENYTFQNDARRSMYVTKVSDVDPSKMYIVSAHVDGRGGGGGANDDASGSALVMEMARIFSDPNVKVDVSVRFILWNNEETGLNGSTAYANNRNSLRGVENPAGSGQYPEPDWLGVIQHDKILYDHGTPGPLGSPQIAGADIDIEFQQNSSFASQSEMLANLVKASNLIYAKDYPSEVSNNMDNTDSKPFQNFCPSISLRENRRNLEIGNGSDPTWHQPTDIVSTFIIDDFNLGFNHTQTTMSFIATATNAEIMNDPCVNQTTDTDGDGIADGIDNCPTTPNTNQADMDNDNLGDLCDSCPSLDNNLIGTPCEDGDPCTSGETYNASCGCSGGIFQDSDNDSVCDANDQCPGFNDALIGTSCDDGNTCTDNDIYTNCDCAGTPQSDADNDGICDDNDQCPGQDDALIGTSCDDGNACTTGETYDSSCSCSGGTEVDSDNDGTCDALDDCPNDPNDTCNLPNLCSNNATNVNYEYIQRVTFLEINNNSGSNGGYGDFSTQTASVTSGNTYPIELVPGFASTAYSEHWKVWIDFNGDGDLNDAGEEVYSGNSTSTLNGNVTIPANAANGTRRMRVTMQYNAAPSSSCGSFQYGEVEDYTVAIGPTCNVGASCDDGDACTTGETYDASCGCTGGTIVDSDGDNVCDALDVCPNFDDNLDSDSDGTPDGCDTCPNAATDDSDNDNICDDIDDCVGTDAVATASSDATICSGEITNLTASGGVIYNWAPQSGLNNPSIANPTASPSITTTYVVTVTNASGCTDTDNVTITVNTLPSADTGSDAEICIGESIQLQATGGSVYNWSPQTGLNSISIANPNASPLITTTYTVMVTDANGCTDTDQITITVIQDSDGDEVCDDVDSCPNLDNTLIGTACDDGDDCTTGETYDASCECSGGVSSDSDNDGTCDVQDTCPNFDNNLIGTICDDGDDCTTGETYDASCGCSGGITSDSDNDGTCDALDSCPNLDNTLIGSACDDGDDCTVGETYDASCGCSGGVSSDSDNDGTCDVQDTCPNFDNNLIGTACDDGDDCTVGETYDASCGCSGGVSSDSDNDGTCDVLDTCPNLDNTLIGTTCDDGDACTIGETYDASCGCSGGTLLDANNNDICDLNESSCNNVTPDSESFETGLGSWSQGSGDDLNWTRDSGGTPSSSTGPSGGADGNWYMYIEASNPNFPSFTASLESDCYNLLTAGTASLGFSYHMYGTANNLKLEVQVSTDEGSTWSAPIWTQQGNFGNQWNVASVDLTAYVGQVINLRFFGTTGETWQGDVAIDAVNVTSTEPCLTEGDTCSDGDDCTTGDQIDTACECEGTYVDNDDDGVCASDDADDNDPCVPVLCGACTELDEQNFENGLGIWNDGGSDCFRLNNTTYSNSGNYSIRIRDNSGAGSSLFSDPLDLSGYSTVEVSFTYFPNSMEGSEDFFLEVSTNGGSSYSIYEEWNNNVEFTNGTRENELVEITGINFTTNTVLRFRCDASGNGDQIYLDDIKIEGCTGSNFTAEPQALSRDNTVEAKEIISLEDISLRPNPVSHLLIVDGIDLNVVDIEIYNTAGASIMRHTSRSPRIDVSGLNSGLYILKVTDGKQVVTRRFIKE